MTSRRFFAGLIRIGLVALAAVVVAGYVRRHLSNRSTIRVQASVPAADSALGPGDMRIYNADSAVDVVLQGDKILAGLSPKTIAKVRTDMTKSDTSDTSDGPLGASISQLVKKTVANAIGTHVVYRVADVRNLRYEDGQIVFNTPDGKQHQLFNDAKVDKQHVSDTFRRDDAERFIAAVKARQSAP